MKIKNDDDLTVTEGDDDGLHDCGMCLAFAAVAKIDDDSVTAGE